MSFLTKIEDRYQITAWMNEWDIDEAVDKYRNHPVLGKATKFLAKFRDVVNSNSDGWAYWKAASAAAKQLCNMIEHPETATEEALKKAIIPIKSLCTRKKLPFDSKIEAAVAEGETVFQVKLNRT